MISPTDFFFMLVVRMMITTEKPVIYSLYLNSIMSKRNCTELYVKNGKKKKKDFKNIIIWAKIIAIEAKD